MNRKTFLTRSFGIAVTSLALTLFCRGMLMAQVVDLEHKGRPGGSSPTPGVPAVAAQAATVLASEELLQGVHVDLLELKRTSGGTLTLKFAVVNDTSQEHSFALLPLLGHINQIALLDFPNKKKYLVMTDSAGGCVCSRYDGLTLKPGNRATFWAKFQAPPDQVTKVTVEMPGVPPFEDVSVMQ